MGSIIRYINFKNYHEFLDMFNFLIENNQNFIYDIKKNIHELKYNLLEFKYNKTDYIINIEIKKGVLFEENHTIIKLHFLCSGSENELLFFTDYSRKSLDIIKNLVLSYNRKRKIRNIDENNI